MKSLFLFLALTATSAMASTIDVHTFPILSTNGEENFQLKATQTRTAYRQENVARTCYRTEFDGYRRDCDYFPETRCYETRGPARVCSTVPVMSCRDVPQYRQVAYTCYQNITTPYEVFDHNVSADFNVKINSKPKEPSNPTGCRVGYTMEGETLHASAECSEYFVLSREVKKTEIDREGNVFHHYDVVLDLLDTKSVLAPLDGGIEQMKLEGNTLTFRTGDLSKNANFKLKIYVEKKHLLKKDEVLLDRELTRSEFSFFKINERYGVVKINLAQLAGEINPKKKHLIKADLNVNLSSGTVLNKDLPALTTHSEITVND